MNKLKVIISLGGCFLAFQSIASLQKQEKLRQLEEKLKKLEAKPGLAEARACQRQIDILRQHLTGRPPAALLSEGQPIDSGQVPKGAPPAVDFFNETNTLVGAAEQTQNAPPRAKTLSGFFEDVTPSKTIQEITKASGNPALGSPLDEGDSPVKPPSALSTSTLIKGSNLGWGGGQQVAFVSTPTQGGMPGGEESREKELRSQPPSPSSQYVGGASTQVPPQVLSQPSVPSAQPSPPGIGPWGGQYIDPVHIGWSVQVPHTFFMMPPPSRKKGPKAKPSMAPGSQAHINKLLRLWKARE